MKSVKNLTVLMSWHVEQDMRKKKMYERNKRSFQQLGESVEVVTIMSSNPCSSDAEMNNDILVCQWFVANHSYYLSEFYLIINWNVYLNLSTLSNSLELEFSDCELFAPAYHLNDLHIPESTTHDFHIYGLILSKALLSQFSKSLLLNKSNDKNTRIFSTLTALKIEPAIFSTDSDDSRSLFSMLSRNSLNPFLDCLESVESLLKLMPTKEIPKILHQTWKRIDLPPKVKLLSESWKILHPKWIYILWTDEMNRAFIAKHFSWFLDIYDSYPYNIQRVDSVRYFILFKYGGVFIDLDFECKRNIESLLNGQSCVFGLEPSEHAIRFKVKDIICNAFMATIPKHGFFLTICKSLSIDNHNSTTSKSKFILESTGPLMLTKIYKKYTAKQNVKLIESKYIYPITFQESRILDQIPFQKDLETKIESAYAVHYFSGTWLS